MALFIYTVRGKKRLKQLLDKGSSNFLPEVRKRWAIDGQQVVGKIVREQLSGRPGLKRVSGDAARALNTTTIQEGNSDVVQKYFIPESNPAKVYLPIHDKSWKKSRIIRPKNKKYLHFKWGKGKNDWAMTKRVKIPRRTNIIETIVKDGKRRRAISLNTILRELIPVSK